MGVVIKVMKRIVSIQDISCFGKCSLTVALPIISAMGIETCVIPTAVLSTHTGSGFEGYTYHDLTEDIPAIASHWQKLGMRFDAISTGYLGSQKQVAIVLDFFRDFGTKDNRIIVDPVLGDKGTYYKGLDDSYAQEMRRLCAQADVIMPNLTEASLLLGEPYRGDSYSESYVKDLLRRLAELGAREVLLTGVSFDERHQGVVAYNRDLDTFFDYFTENIPGYFHSTGDVFSATLSGALVLGLPIDRAIRTAVDFTVECIRHTVGHEREHWYSVRFEECLPWLIKAVGK